MSDVSSRMPHCHREWNLGPLNIDVNIVDAQAVQSGKEMFDHAHLASWGVNARGPPRVHHGIDGDEPSIETTSGIRWCRRQADRTWLSGVESDALHLQWVRNRLAAPQLSSWFHVFVGFSLWHYGSSGYHGHHLAGCRKFNRYGRSAHAKYASSNVLVSLGMCGGDSGEASMELLDAGMSESDAGPREVVCSTETRRAETVGELNCGGEPEFVRVIDNGRPFQIFKYEASHPLATATDAFPCAATQGESFQAPDVRTEACSAGGVIPWHSVKWKDAEAACEAIGWRLCEEEELIRSCEGPDGTRYTFGATFEPGTCNVQDAYRPADSDFSSVAPTGHFTECVSSEGAFDLTGNLWEWSNKRLDSDGDARFYHSAGWRTVAERHRDTDQVCTVETFLRGFSARSFLAESVGFRCCRDDE